MLSKPGPHRVQPARDVVLLRGESGISDGPGWMFPGCCLPEVPPALWRSCHPCPPSRGLEWLPLGLGHPVPGLRGFSRARGCCGGWYIRPCFFYSFERSQFSFLLLAAAAAKSLQSCPTLRPYRRQPTRLPHPWDSPGKNTGVGCHFLLQCMKVKSESEVAQSCLTLRNPMDCILPGSSVHESFQARVLEWGAIALTST